MADFEKACEFIKSFEGGHFEHLVEDDDKKVILCSNCFQDEGLKATAWKIGLEKKTTCPNCKFKYGNKLTRFLAKKVCYSFFVRGTIHKTEFGGSPVVQFNHEQFNKSTIDLPSWLDKDVNLLEQRLRIGLFYYGPRLWMIGDITPLLDLQNVRKRKKVINKILKEYPMLEIPQTHYFFRLRINPEKPDQASEYDSAPDGFLGMNRFDRINFPVLYGSPDLELCLHECRTTVEDSLFFGKLVPNKPLKLLDLSAHLSEEGTEFESLDIAVRFLFLAGKHSYDICRDIAQAAMEAGYDGLRYPSFFSSLRTGENPFETIYGISIRRVPDLKEYIRSSTVSNLAIFGRPIHEGKIKVDCINKISINRIAYDIGFGPALPVDLNE